MFTEGVIGSPTQTTLGPVLASPAPVFLLDPILSGSLCPRPFLVLFSFLSCSFSPCLSLSAISLCYLTPLGPLPTLIKILLYPT